MRKILVIVPCYNAGRHIRKVVGDIKKYNKHILVVDDGSTDNSYDAIKNIKGIEVIRHEKNRGKGAALKTGFSYALKNNFDAVITIDADGQHKAEDIPKFLTNFDSADIIIGNRMNNVGNMPMLRIFANIISSSIVSGICNQQINDSQSGYRLIKSEILNNMELKRDDYHMETEILLKAAEKGYTMGDVPIKVAYGGKGTSHISPVSTLKFFRTIIER